MLGKQLQTAAAGAAGGDKVYVDDVFSTFLYDGTGSTQNIVNGIDLSGEGGMVWVKCRNSDLFSHQIGDTERGPNNNLSTNSSAQNYTHSGKFTAFNSDGFTLGNNGAVNNSSSQEYCSWTFRKCPGFFDIVEFNTADSHAQTISHNLGSTPGFIIVKRTNDTSGWFCWHRTFSSDNNYLRLDRDNALYNLGQAAFSNVGASSFDFNSAGLIGDGHTCIAYIFAHDDQSFGTNEDEAIIKCGSYTGNTSTKPFIDLGFEPQWVMIKRTSNTDPWILFDNIRGIPTGQFSERLEPNNSNAEDTFGRITLFPNGFESTYNTGFQNSNGETYVYMAIRRPHKPPSTGTEVFNPSTQVGTVPNFSTNFPVDFAIRLLTGGGNTTYSQMVISRLTGERFMPTSQTNAEAAPSSFSIDLQHMDGWGDMGGGGTALSFKRAPGFMDVVTYTGNGSTQTVNHGLGVAPELMIIKNRDAVGGWITYTSSLGAGKNVKLHSSGGEDSNATFFNNTTPSATQFFVGGTSAVNGSGNGLIACLFASLPGISKVGTYTFSGSDIDVDCGFTNGARLVIIKGLDSGKDWSIFDTSRGIVSGNDPKIAFNNTDAQDSGGDWIDPINSGFRVLASAGNDVSDSGVTYLFLAIA